MKILAAVAMVLIYCISVSAECVTVTGPSETKSFQNARITVLLDKKPQEGVRLLVQLPNGRGSRSFFTDSHGTVMLKDLPAGTNCVRADGEDHLGAFLCLTVSQDSNPEISAFVLTLADTLGSLPPIGDAPPDVLRQLEVVAQDVSGGIIPNADVRVFARQSYPKNPLVKTATDQYGRVAISLDPGIYAVAVRSQGFKPAVQVVEISPDGRAGQIIEVLQVYSC
jgi:hypothetical protein